MTVIPMKRPEAGPGTFDAWVASARLVAAQFCLARGSVTLEEILARCPPPDRFWPHG